MLIAAIALITLALVLYTSGIFLERREGLLRPLHAAFFSAGFLADASGTAMMSAIAGAGTYAATGLAATLTTLMAVTGAAALLLMGAHLAWALVVLARGSERARRLFHRFSLAVWGFWLIPYGVGAASAMMR